jgi:Protein of unknown function (DUF2442)
MRITQAKALPGFRLELQYESGESGVVELSALVGRGVFSAWEDPTAYNAVRVTQEGALEWPGEIDLCPDALYLQMTGKTPQEVFPALSGQTAHA